MKIKKVLLAVIVAIFAVIGCTSCGAKKIGSTTETTPTVVVTRPDYGGNIKVEILGTFSYQFKKVNELVNTWLEDNRDKTIVDIVFFCDANDVDRLFAVIIIYRDNNATPTEQ